MGNVNRKPCREEIAAARKAIREAYPDYVAVFGCHGDYGGHRAPRVRTIAFRLRDKRGRFHSNVVWLMPDWLCSLTADDVRLLVDRANGRFAWRR